MAIFLMLLVVSGFVLLQYFIYKNLWGKRLTFSLTVSSATVFEGDSLTIRETLNNDKLLPLPWVEVNFELPRSFVPDKEDSLLGSTIRYRTDLFSMRPYRRLALESEYRCVSRGFYKIKDFYVGSYNLMMAGYQKAALPVTAAVTVYPRVINVSEFDIPYKRLSGEIVKRRFILPDPFEFKGIREYQPYDSFKDINFKASARTGALMSNVFDCTVSQELAVVLNLQRYSHVTNQNVCENAIRLAAFLARYFIGVGIPVSFITNGRDCVTGAETEIPAGLSQNHLSNIYEALARIDLITDKRGITELLTVASEESALSEKVYVLISSYTGADLRQWYGDFMDMGRAAMWIVPFEPGDGALDDSGAGFTDFVPWEVEPVE